MTEQTTESEVRVTTEQPAKRRPGAWCASFGGQRAAFVMVVLAGALAYWWGSVRSSQTTDIAGLYIDHAALDFGTTWVNREFRWKLPIRNASSEVRDIDAFSRSCSCLKVEPESLSLAPGQVAELQVAVDLSAGSPTPNEYRNVVVSLMPRIRDVNTRRAWHLHGRVRNPFRGESSTFPLEELLIEGSEGLNVTIPLQFRKSMRRVEPVSIPKGVRAATANLELSGTECQLRVTIAPINAPGQFTLPILIDAEAADGEVLKGVPISVVGRLVPEIRVVPERVVLRPSPTNRGSDTIVLYSRHARPLTVLSAITSSRRVSVRPAAKSVRAGVAFSIEATEPSPNPWTQLTFSVRAGGIPAVQTVNVDVFSVPPFGGYNEGASVSTGGSAQNAPIRSGPDAP